MLFHRGTVRSFALRRESRSCVTGFPPSPRVSPAQPDPRHRSSASEKPCERPAKGTTRLFPHCPRSAAVSTPARRTCPARRPRGSLTSSLRARRASCQLCCVRWRLRSPHGGAKLRSAPLRSALPGRGRGASGALAGLSLPRPPRRPTTRLPTALPAPSPPPGVCGGAGDTPHPAPLPGPGGTCAAAGGGPRS